MKISIKLVSSVLMTVIIVIVIMQVLADTGDDIGSAAGNVSIYNATGNLEAGADGDAYSVFPITSFFKKKGVILLALMAGLVIGVISAVLSFAKKR